MKPIDAMNINDLRLDWQMVDPCTLRGYLEGRPETTLFLIGVDDTAGPVTLHGAFVPDSDERVELSTVEGAKQAARSYMLDWLRMVYRICTL